MNKSLLIVLAICLVTVHGFVKRDAPSTESALDTLKKQVQDLGDQITKQVQGALQPDELKKNFDDTIKKITSAIDSLAPKPEAPKQ